MVRARARFSRESTRESIATRAGRGGVAKGGDEPIRTGGGGAGDAIEECEGIFHRVVVLNEHHVVWFDGRALGAASLVFWFFEILKVRAAGQRFSRRNRTRCGLGA
jgi:hypothetical protein